MAIMDIKSGGSELKTTKIVKMIPSDKIDTLKKPSPKNTSGRDNIKKLKLKQVSPM